MPWILNRHFCTWVCTFGAGFLALSHQAGISCCTAHFCRENGSVWENSCGVMAPLRIFFPLHCRKSCGWSQAVADVTRWHSYIDSSPSLVFVVVVYLGFMDEQTIRMEEPRSGVEFSPQRWFTGICSGWWRLWGIWMFSRNWPWFWGGIAGRSGPTGPRISVCGFLFSLVALRM